MAASPEAYLYQLQALLPPGKAWSRDPDAVLSKLLLAMGDGLARAARRAEDLLEEIDPRTTVELLPDWERVAGLPDPCAGPSPTLATRQAILTAKLISRGGQSRAYLIGVAAALGYTITIEEFRLLTCQSACDAALNTNPWRFAWRVHAPAVTVKNMTCQSGCDEPLRSWGNAVLECTLNRLKPAHTHIIFAYDGD